MNIFSTPGFRNVWILSLSNALAASIMTLMILVGSLVGAELAPSAKWATLPIALTVIGTAVSILPATRCMQLMGRKHALWAFMALGIFACWLASSALGQQSFSLFCIAAVLLGSTNAALQQTRFAAMESVDPESGPTAASLMMCGGILAAIIGPELAVAGAHLTAVDYQGSYWLAAATVILGAILLAFYIPTVVPLAQQTAHASPTLNIIRNPTFILAVTSGAVAFVVMSFVMTGTPISMHHIYGHSLEDTKWVIQSHIAAMYLPSLFTGTLIKRFHSAKILIAGTLMFAVVALIALNGQQVMHYWWTMVLLGIGWNFLFITGTVLLPESYHGNERFKVQALNDFVIFAVQASASLLAGWIIFSSNWAILIYSILPFIAIMLLISIWHYKNRQNN